MIKEKNYFYIIGFEKNDFKFDLYRKSVFVKN